MGDDKDLYHAAGCGNVHRVRQLLDRGASTHYKAHGVMKEPSLWSVTAVCLYVAIMLQESVWQHA